MPVAAAAPNIASVYHRRLRLEGQLFLAVSQSGRSDDLVANAAMAREAGALTAALVNDTESPLAAACDIVLPICAGPERSVAATKTFVASLAALLRLVADWAGDRPLAAPSIVCRSGSRAPAISIGAPRSTRSPRRSSLVAIGRGPTLAIAREAALKLKEVANLHAEAFSGAEFLHGPVALVGAALSDPRADADRRRRAGMRALVPTSRQGRGGVRGRPDGALPVLAPGPSRNRRGLPDPGLLCDDRAAGGAARHRPGPAAPSAKGHADAMRGAIQAMPSPPTIVFDGAALHRDGAVVIEGADIAALVPRARTAAGHSAARDAAGGMAGPGVHRYAGQWRRRRAVQRRPDPRRHPRDRRRASPLRHDRACCRP